MEINDLAYQNAIKFTVHTGIKCQRGMQLVKQRE